MSEKQGGQAAASVAASAAAQAAAGQATAGRVDVRNCAYEAVRFGEAVNAPTGEEYSLSLDGRKFVESLTRVSDTVVVVWNVKGERIERHIPWTAVQWAQPVGCGPGKATKPAAPVVAAVRA